MTDARYRYPYAQAGAEGPPPRVSITQQVSEGVSEGLRGITPTFVLVGVVTGMAFALGAGLVNRYLFKDHKK